MLKHHASIARIVLLVVMIAVVSFLPAEAVATGKGSVKSRRDHNPPNALDLRDSHKEEMKRLAAMETVSRVEVVVEDDEFWYFRLTTKEGLVGVATQDAKVIIAPQCESVNYVPRQSAGRYEKVVESFIYYTYAPESRASFLVKRAGKHEIVGLDGRTLNSSLSSAPVRMGGYWATGLDEKGTALTLVADSLPRLELRSLQGEHMRLYTLDGREVTLSSPKVDGGVETYFIDDQTVRAASMLFQPVDSAFTTLSIDCSNHSGAQVSIDGKRFGTTPLSIELKSGGHNVSVDYDHHHLYRAVKYCELPAGENCHMEFTLKPMPPKSYVFAIAQYGLLTTGKGVMVGTCREWGAYGKVMMAGKSVSKEQRDEAFGENVTIDPVTVMKLSHSLRSYSVGAMRRVNNFLYVNAGLGYTEYSSGDVYGHFPEYLDGLTLDMGVVVRHHALVASVGYSPMVVYSHRLKGTYYDDFHIGIGLTLRINRRR